MAEKFISDRNLKFLLFEAFNVESLLKYPRYADHSREVFDMVVDTAMKVATNLYKPLLVEMDRKGPEYVNGEVKVHPDVRKIMKEAGEGGWIAATAPFELGGQQLPEMIFHATTCIFAAANYSAVAYPGLTTGAAGLIISFCPKEMWDLYLPKMFSGEWQGTMALTEPQAGSSLSDITTTAEPTSEGYYKVRGQKLFISCGEHDGVDNIINLALARIKGAPAGVKGISLFIIPKKRFDGKGGLEFNDVNCAGIYHKMGYKGSPITQLSFGENDDCRGWLVGEPNKGLSYMFQMMNGARIDVGVGATGIASAAYYAALEYAQQRPQGRPLAAKNPEMPQVPIIEHPDVKRMLLFQKSVVEGSQSILVQCAYYHDMEKVTEGEEHENYGLLLDLLTPIAKTYPSEMSNLTTSAAIQIHGGYGFCEEFPVEQFYRDTRIHTIHEGTTGIQGIDLLGRKVKMKNGKAYNLFLGEVDKTIKIAEAIPALAGQTAELKKAIENLKVVTKHLLDISAKGDNALFLADGTLYLECFSIIAIAWQWLLQATIADKALKGDVSADDKVFYTSKLYTMKYFFGYELPKIEGLIKRLMNGDGLTVEMPPELFD